jgi:hypothetical protein
MAVFSGQLPEIPEHTPPTLAQLIKVCTAMLCLNWLAIVTILM